MSVIVIEFVSVDGVMQDPDGAEGTPQGGWAFRFGPGPVAGDKFRLGPLLDTCTLLLGRKTWQHFAGIWPNRSDEFSTKLNRMPKLVASRSLDGADTGAWSNSTLLDGELVDEVSRRKATQDIVVTGSLSVVRTLVEHDLVDEYRLLVFPTVVGEGPRLFAGGRPADLDLVSVERSGPAVLLVYRRASVAEERK
jgi:dihydrofolate reductase